MLEDRLNEDSIEPGKSQKPRESEEAKKKAFEDKYGSPETRMLYEVFYEFVMPYFESKGINLQPSDSIQSSEEFIRVISAYQQDECFSLANSETNWETAS